MEKSVLMSIAALIASRSRDSSTSSSSSDDEILILNRGRLHVKILNYVKNIALKYDDIDFRSHFRLNKTAVENLCQELNLERNLIIPGRPSIKPLDSVLITLWLLANQESFRGVADRFGISKGHCHQIFIKICQKICELREAYVAWPTREEMLRNAQDFENIRQEAFPGVIGCIDGCHIRIRGTSKDNSFYNRKGYTSMIIQAICNSNQEFINIYCGWPGSSHDARVFSNSPIFNRMAEGIIPEGYHILGDSAYPLKEFLMVPFKDNGHLTRNQKIFNKRLSSTRVVIENAFGRLKGIFRRLQYLNIVKYDNFKYIVVAACILHNIILKNNIPVAYEAPDFVEAEIQNHEQYVGTATARAKQKRTHIMYSFIE